MKYLLAGLAAALIAGSTARAEPPSRMDVPPSDPAFTYLGRIDASIPSAPVLIWEASRVRVGFTGDALVLRFGPTTDQAYFDLSVDGKTSLVALRRGSPPRGTMLDGLGPGPHTLELFKRSEASAGTVPFLGISLAAGARVFVAPPENRGIRIEFIGDSITAGACSEDGAADQWEDRSTHTSGRSYAWLTCQAFGADGRLIAVSGMGVSTGWTTVLARQAWDRLYPSADSKPADLGSWEPDLVFVNLGENDSSFTEAHGKPFPADFAEQYERLIRSVRAARPGARIILLRGGMAGGNHSPELVVAWQAAVGRLEASDPKISHYVFAHWSNLHPRVADHRAMADELIGWLRRQPFAARD